jgi:hypothetical protein
VTKGAFEAGLTTNLRSNQVAGSASLPSSVEHVLGRLFFLEASLLDMGMPVQPTA